MTMRDESADWQHLNAYADGELPEDEARRVELRLAADPGFRQELDRLLDLKAGLGQLRPVAAGPLPASPRRGRLRRYGTAIAAAIVVATLVAGVLALLPGRSTWVDYAMALHEGQSGRAYVVEEGYRVQTVSTGGALEFRAPDLTASRLYLVDVASSHWSGRESIAMHYRGLNGCRLTIVAVEAAGSGEGDAQPGGGLIRTWRHDGFHFAVIANGMDAARFASAAAFAEAAIDDTSREAGRMRTAMTETRARPCA